MKQIFSVISLLSIFHVQFFPWTAEQPEELTEASIEYLQTEPCLILFTGFIRPSYVLICRFKCGNT